MALFVIYKDTRGEFRWRLRADNNEIIADSAEGYVTKTACENGIALVKRQAAGADVRDDTEK